MWRPWSEGSATGRDGVGRALPHGRQRLQDPLIEPVTTLTCDQALEKLLGGNRRYVALRQLHPRQSVNHRQRLVEGQRPFAAVLSCSDSRVPSEIIFDQGLGDLFMVRTAGHAVNGLVLASVEYAVYALGVPLVIVVGHAQCGAVRSVMEGQALPGHLPELVETLRPAIAGIALEAPEALDLAIRSSARLTAARLQAESPILQEAVASGRLRIVAAHYDLRTFQVELLD
ncbi:MAG: carbonic anhydrase [Deltaproteobacteria bacterium]|nr:MAG: carbonic anhydrase [Deltaproteobacteria bacterium]